MSFDVLVIPEDPTLNGYILKPLAQAIVADAGRPRANVTVLSRPRLRGYDHAVRSIRGELAELYSHLNLWLFFPDSDKATNDTARDLEAHAEAKGIRLLVCISQPEVEVYPCVAFRDEIGHTWDEVRNHPQLKEDIFSPLLATHGDRRRAGAGRDRMIRESVANLPLLFRLCPELRHLRDRIASHLGQD